MRPWIPLLCTLCLAPMARAQEDCAEPYTVDAMLTDLALTEAALRSADNAAAGEVAHRIEQGLACAEDVLPGAMVGRLYRALGAGIFVGGDPDQGLAWLRTAAELEPDYEYTEDELPADHPARAGLKLAKVEIADSAPQPMEGAPELAKGSHFLDGRALQRAEATLDRRHVYQRHDEATHSFVISGNAFPELAFAQPEPAPPPEPEVPEPEATQPLISDAILVTQNKWPTERVILLGAGGATLVASGTLYGLSASSRARFKSAESVEDVDRYTRSTNTLAIASGATGAAGLGLAGFGALFFVIDGDPRPTLDFRF